MSSVRTHPQPVLLMMLLLLLLQTQLVVVHSLLASTGTFMNPTAVPAVPCLPDHASALLRLKWSFATTNESIAAFRSWRAGTDCCGWEGIRCRGGKGRVTSLDLSHRRLRSRALNPSLFNLTSLEHLNLAYNDFGGSRLPSTGFERLLKLTHLNLSSSSFDGQVPTGIRQLTNLVSLDLSTGFEIVEMLDHGFQYHIDINNVSIQLLGPNFQALIAKLSNLRELKLGLVDLSGNSAQWCDALAKSTPKLRLLSLPACRLLGPICTSLSSLHALAIIDLEHNHLSGPFPEFLANFSSLRVLKLNRNELEGWVSPAIFEQKKLVTINLYRNLGLSGNLPNFSTTNSLENLVVSRTNLSGTIPSSISNLKSLKRLGLGACFSGEIPLSIGELVSLNALEISGKELAGSIPSWVANLTSLKTLEFSDCGLSGSIPSVIGDLTKLERLILCGCNFSGKIPSRISNLTQLQTLFLYSNNLFGTVELTSLRKLPHLYAFDISSNNLVVVNGDVNSSLVSFPKLGILGLSGCSMSKFPTFLRHQYEIYYLDLSYNEIHGAVPHWAWESRNGFMFFNLANNKFTNVGYSPLLPTNIELLDLSNNMFEGPIPIPLGSVTGLDYSSNKFSSIPSNFSSHLSDITLLTLSQNNFSGNIPPSFCGALGIQFLDLSSNNFSGSIPACLMENVNGMVSLKLKENQLHGEFPDNINEECSLEALDFSGNLIAGQLPRSLVACKNLQILDVGNNQISDSFPCWMSSLERLEVLILKSNKLFGHVAQSPGKEKKTCAFPSARIVDLSSNNFSGPLPQDQWFKKLKSMIVRDSNMSLIMNHGVPQTSGTYDYTTAITYKGHDTSFAKILRTLVFIDVSNNSFHGDLPKVIGELVLLHGLNLSHNFLTGMIPSQVVHLNQLEALDLSSNKLSGVIPQEIASLDFLTTLNLSYNKLEGKIPESPHFLTFSNNSFLGNDGLCGSPLSKECNNATTPNVVRHTSEKSSIDIMLFLFTGLGFGVGFAVVVVTWLLPRKKRS